MSLINANTRLRWNKVRTKSNFLHTMCEYRSNLSLMECSSPGIALWDTTGILSTHFTSHMSRLLYHRHCPLKNSFTSGGQQMDRNKKRSYKTGNGKVFTLILLQYLYAYLYIYFKCQVCTRLYCELI